MNININTNINTKECTRAGAIQVTQALLITRKQAENSQKQAE